MAGSSGLLPEESPAARSTPSVKGNANCNLHTDVSNEELIAHPEYGRGKLICHVRCSRLCERRVFDCKVTNTAFRK